MYNKKGAIYFINILTLSNNGYMILPIDIRKIIWNYLHTYSYINCYICDKNIINFSTRIDKITDDIIYYTIINGLTKCNNCFID